MCGKSKIVCFRDSRVHAGSVHGRKDSSKEMGHHRVTKVQMGHGGHLDQCWNQANAECHTPSYSSRPDILGSHDEQREWPGPERHGPSELS